MEKINHKEIKFQEYKYYYDSNNSWGQKKLKKQSDPDEGFQILPSGNQQKRIDAIDLKIIEGKDIVNFQKFLKTIDDRLSKSSNIEGSVFFDKSVTFPRHTFRESYPNNNIVRNPEKAKTVVVDLEKIKKEYSHFYQQNFIPQLSGRYTTSEYYEPNLTDKSKKVIRGAADEKSIVLDKINNIIVSLTDSSKNIIDCKSIIIKDQISFTDESYSTIEKLFKSNNQDDIPLALKLLCNFNYEEDKSKIAWVLHMNRFEYNRCYNKKLDVTLKLLLNKLKKDFGNWETLNTIDFLLENINSFKDKILFTEEMFNRYCKESYNMPDNVRFRLEIDDTKNNRVEDVDTEKEENEDISEEVSNTY